MSKVPNSRSGANGPAPESPKGPRPGKAGPSAAGASGSRARSANRSAGTSTGTGKPATTSTGGAAGTTGGAPRSKGTKAGSSNTKSQSNTKSARTSAGKAGTPPRASGKGGGGNSSSGPDRPRPTLTSRAAILALVVCAIALSLAYPLREYVLQRAELAQLKEERERTQQSVNELEQRHEELQDPDHIEREARERLHYQYPGERAYVIVGDGDEDAGEDSAADSEPWFTRLWKSVQEADQTGEQEEEIPEAQPPDR